MKKFFALLAIIVAIAACNNNHEPAKLTPEQQRAEALAKSAENQKLLELLEQQRSTALGNVQVAIADYFAANPRFTADWKIVPHTDDYISSSCPQGSGWGWANIMHVDGKEVEKKTVWCSVFSRSLGCFIEADFTKGPHAAEAKRCNPDLPHPLKSFK